MAESTTPTRGGWRTTAWGEYLSEFLGTFVLIALGDGVVAMAVAALNQSGRGTDIGTAAGSGLWVLIALGWALAVAFGVYVAGGVSGAHINPAVTLALAVKRGFPWKKVPGYMIAQTIGAFVGAALVFLVYQQAIASYESANDIVRGTTDSTVTFSIFATFPAPYFTTTLGPLVDQIVGTALLVGVILALLDSTNMAPKANVGPLLIGLVVGAIGLSFGANAGYAINPARDFGPRVFSWFAGWGDVAFPGALAYWWVPIVGPLIGGVLGALIYDFCIADTLKARGTQSDPEVEPEGDAGPAVAEEEEADGLE